MFLLYSLKLIDGLQIYQFMDETLQQNVVDPKPKKKIILLFLCFEF